MKFALCTFLIFLFGLGFGLTTCGNTVPQEKPKTPEKREFVPKTPKNGAFCTIKPLIIAVIDTGFGFEDRGHEAKLCKFGHKDFSGAGSYSAKYGTKAQIPLDINGHGTNIAGIIDTYAKKNKANYCLVILKYFHRYDGNTDVEKSTTEAIKYATAIKADFINYSAGGNDFNKEEAAAVKKFLDKGGRFIAAAGNAEPMKPPNDLEEVPYYPAMDDERVVIVGNLNHDGKRAPTSNYGSPVTRWEIGERVDAYGITLTGTSQAAAIATGKIVSEISCKH